mgnify:CR=1 FL=1
MGKKYEDTDGSVNWTEIESKFDNLVKFDEKFYFLRELVDDLNICDNTTCKIYPEIHQLKQKLKTLKQWGYNTYKDGIKDIENEIDKKKWTKDFQEFDNLAEHVFSKIFAMKTSKDTQEQQHEQGFQEYCETLKIINENNFPMPLQIQNSVQSKMDEITSNAIQLDDRLKDKRKEFQSFMEEMKSKKKSKNKKSTRK